MFVPFIPVNKNYFPNERLALLVTSNLSVYIQQIIIIKIIELNARLICRFDLANFFYKTHLLKN